MTREDATSQSKKGHWIFDDKCKEHGHCSECGYGSIDLIDGRPHRFCQNCGAKMEHKQEWIPVSERLPEEETDVLICNGNGDIALSRGSYSTEIKNDFIWYTSGWRFGKVIAWMPLPEPYKTESEVEATKGEKNAQTPN